MNDKPASSDRPPLPPSAAHGSASSAASDAAANLPQGWTGGPPDTEAFFQMAEAALSKIPTEFQPHIQDLLILVEDMADADTLHGLGIDNPLELTGLYEGYPLTERSIDQSGAMPDRVTLYRIPILMEWAEGGERLDWLISHVLIHEIGHHFGFSDDDMHALEEMSRTQDARTQAPA